MQTGRHSILKYIWFPPKITAFTRATNNTLYYTL